MSAASIAGQVNETFDLTSYIPSDIQTDISTGAGYYAAFSQATQGVTFGPHGTIAMSDGAKQAVFQAMAGTVAVSVPVAGPVIAALLELYAIAPHAGAGPGVCGTDPPAGPAPSQLTAWSHFVPWNGDSPTGPLNSFEAFANPVLEYNWLLGSNCFSKLMIPATVLLATLIAAWNSRHSASVKRTITRTINMGFVSSPNYDPIADALYWAVATDPKYLTGPYSSFLGTNEYNGPDQVTSSFQINDGPIIIAPLVLHFPGAGSSAAAKAPVGSSTASAPASLGKKVAVSVAIIAAAGAAGVGAWAFATHQSYLGALKGVWKASGGKVIAAVNPLPLAAAEAFEASSKKTTIQTLIFPRPRYSESRAKAWARSHSYTVHKAPDVKANTIRIRQRDPGDFKSGSFRTITLGKSGVKAVVGHLR